MDKANPDCACQHHNVAPFALIGIGLVFLMNAIGVLQDSFAAVTWPILLIIAGLAKVSGRECACCGRT